MTEQHTAAVSAYNDWDPLKEIIVGVADGSVESAYEPALAPFYAREDSGRSCRGRPYPSAAVAAAQKQLDALALRLEREGIERAAARSR